MAINTQTVANVQGDVSATGTSETNFQRGADNIIAQVDRSVNSISFGTDATGAAITGAQLSGTFTLADGTTDNQIHVNPTLQAGTIQANNIRTSDLQTLTVSDSGGTVIFQSFVFVNPIPTT